MPENIPPAEPIGAVKKRLKSVRSQLTLDARYTVGITEDD